MNIEATVFVVDDDQAMRASLQRLMESVGLAAKTYASAEEFLQDYDPAWPGCLILDIRMPGMTGLELQDKLVLDGIRMPTIIISAHGDVEKAVQAMKSGAVDFIKKPYKGKVLLTRIREALELDARLRLERAQRADVAARVARLTPREREVMLQLVAGNSTKKIAFDLGLSRKTVDVHRGHIMAKMQADSLVDLARMVHGHPAPTGTQNHRGARRADPESGDRPLSFEQPPEPASGEGADLTDPRQHYNAGNHAMPRQVAANEQWHSQFRRDERG